MGERACGGEGHQNAKSVETKHHESGMLREEGSGEHRVDRKAGGARHEWQCHHGDEAAFAAVDGARGHHGGHVAAKAH